MSREDRGTPPPRQHAQNFALSFFALRLKIGEWSSTPSASLNVIARARDTADLFDGFMNFEIIVNGGEKVGRVLCAVCGAGESGVNLHAPALCTSLEVRVSAGKSAGRPVCQRPARHRASHWTEGELPWPPS